MVFYNGWVVINDVRVYMQVPEHSVFRILYTSELLYLPYNIYHICECIFFTMIYWTSVQFSYESKYLVIQSYNSSKI